MASESGPEMTRPRQAIRAGPPHIGGSQFVIIIILNQIFPTKKDANKNRIVVLLDGE